MSMNAAEVLDALFENPRHTLYPMLEAWVKGDRRFRTFAERYRGKMRRKLRNAPDAEAAADLGFEFEVAYWLLREARFEVEYETFDARQGGPDYSVAYRVNTRFNLEVRRIRAREADEDRVRKLVETLTDKAKQMPPSAVNLLVMGTEGVSSDDLAAAHTTLRGLAERKVEEFFAHRGYKNAAEFLRQYRQMSAVVLKAQGVVWLNPLAKHPLPKEVALALERLPV